MTALERVSEILRKSRIAGGWLDDEVAAKVLVALGRSNDAVVAPQTLLTASAIGWERREDLDGTEFDMWLIPARAYVTAPKGVEPTVVAVSYYPGPVRPPIASDPDAPDQSGEPADRVSDGWVNRG
jgi:hypothetical protein